MTAPFEHAGTVSHGTLRNEDLAPAFLDKLAEIDADRANKIRAEYGDVFTHMEIGLANANPDAEQALMEALFDALNDVAPEGWSFGAHEGDGSDFGFWWGEDEDGIDLDSLDSVDEIREVQGWNDSTMLDIAHQFIYGHDHRSEAYTDFAREIARTENEGP